MNRLYLVALVSLALFFLSGCHYAYQNNAQAQVSKKEQQSYQKALKREQAIAKHDVWHAAKLKGASFRAIGQEPAWLIEFYPNEKIYLSRSYGEIIQSFKYQAPVTDKVKRRSVFILDIESESQGKVIIEGKPCTDIMSGENFETTVTVVIDEQVLKGCGKALY